MLVMYAMHGRIEVELAYLDSVLRRKSGLFSAILFKVINPPNYVTETQGRRAGGLSYKLLYASLDKLLDLAHLRG